MLILWLRYSFASACFPQHATVVSQINVTSALQAHFLRRAIELEVVRTLAQQR
jgi:DNA-binding GntR family transcriptional regulator